MLWFESRHGLWKSVPQSLDHLEQREIDVGSLLAENEVAASGVLFEDSFEIAKKLGDAGRGEIGGALFWPRPSVAHSTGRSRSDGGSGPRFIQPLKTAPFIRRERGRR